MYALYLMQPPAVDPAAAAGGSGAVPENHCDLNGKKALEGPGRTDDLNGGFHIDSPQLAVIGCRAMMHWTASAAVKGCGNVQAKDGPWLSITPVDGRGFGTQDPIVLGEVSVPNASGFFKHDLDVTPHVTLASLKAATRIAVSMGGDSCSHRHVR